MLEALYTLEFGDVYNSPFKNGGVVVLETNRIFGGDSGFYYLGKYNVSGKNITAKVDVTNYNPAMSDVWGLGIKEFSLTLSGTIEGKIIEGRMSLDIAPQTTLFMRFTKIVELP